MALSFDSQVYVLPPGLVELFGLALRLEAPTGRIPTPSGRGAATTVSLLVLAPPGYVAARALGPGDVLITTDIRWTRALRSWPIRSQRFGWSCAVRGPKAPQ